MLNKQMTELNLHDTIQGMVTLERFCYTFTYVRVRVTSSLSVWRENLHVGPSRNGADVSKHYGLAA